MGLIRSWRVLWHQTQIARLERKIRDCDLSLNRLAYDLDIPSALLPDVLGMEECLTGMCNYHQEILRHQDYYQKRIQHHKGKLRYLTILETRIMFP